ncbi:iron-sulfur cluster carrier protein ApbC [Vibrio europaeus]|uniref:Iron-sulfur cluster carrier protein n=1 Tax=Vibrio europaeus TaxID=300876 RepID=A0A178JGK2_9VIBR|nr:iron-sulfur cluster carrier protein ApbC [Vibrio europaeus]MDC5706800.1 iron-sulfur cluster carrier protein ApbC [Vibrio europaeus]MDC5712165.1 iron-sulfur cluster carrier protein ApbC [Vibrio europaeus]MDC5716808.1 iron-sulfur cluster carrier protein ApbC [Vibrio europaeus]MDC5721658.1 iron-sulfur cluster carrier protein ApbC [Vibrio europaeus]MDC5726107.1 iron-sulfur cluster carrier protein ApbC [Vibrio europaeus]
MRQFTSKQDFCDWLNQFEHPSLAPDWASTANFVSVEANQFTIEIPFAANTLTQDLSAWIEASQNKGEVASFSYNIVVAPKSLETHVSATVKGVKNVIAVTSAKGGVGKSTTSVNLALALSKSGAKVGLLDADIYGPSVPLMLGQTNAQPEVRDNKWMQPITAHGIFTHSIGYLVSKDEAAIWRGPMAAKALAQLLNETEWPELDYLVIDMPPGTGDIQLTLAQQVPVTGAVIVTTPQDLALADARKGAAMFNKVDVPVVGLVENMSYHICSHCGEKEHIFGAGGAEKMANEYGLDLLAQIPLHIQMREDIDKGIPTVAARPESEHGQQYLALAEAVSARLYWRGKTKPDSIMFSMVE